VDFERVKDSGRELKSAAAYLELHIEQGPVLLDSICRSAWCSARTASSATRSRSTAGRALGSTPMNRRKDAFLAAAQMSPEIYRIAGRHGGVGTIGSCTTKPAS
jgi:N-carbamoyl-L-amino-acid hydrolase